MRKERKRQTGRDGGRGRRERAGKEKVKQKQREGAREPLN